MISIIPVEQRNVGLPRTRPSLLAFGNIEKGGTPMVQNNTEDDLSPKKPYLSEFLDLEELHKGRANIIAAPCHSGKTTAARAFTARPSRR